MKPKNFPARKLQRKINAGSASQGTMKNTLTALADARNIRSKKKRG